MVAICLSGFLAGCARRGSPVEPEDSGTTALGYRLVTKYPVVGYAEGVDVVDNMGLVAAGEGGLVLFDMSVPSDPVHVGTCPTYFTAVACAYVAADSFAYVTDGPEGVQVFDVSRPSEPVQLGSSLESTSGQDVVAVVVTPGELHHIYVADREGGFRIWEFEYDEQFHSWYGYEVSHIGTEGYARGVCLEDGLAFVATGQTGITVCDASDAGNVLELGEVDTPGNARAVAVSGSHAFVADGLGGLAVVDVSEPTAPVLVASFETEDYASDIVYADGRVLVADRDGGLRVFDVTDPADATLVGYVETPYANGICLAGSYIVVADRDWGLVVIEEE